MISKRKSNKTSDLFIFVFQVLLSARMILCLFSIRIFVHERKIFKFFLIYTGTFIMYIEYYKKEITSTCT